MIASLFSWFCRQTIATEHYGRQKKACAIAGQFNHGNIVKTVDSKVDISTRNKNRLQNPGTIAYPNCGVIPFGRNCRLSSEANECDWYRCFECARKENRNESTILIKMLKKNEMKLLQAAFTHLPLNGDYKITVKFTKPNKTNEKFDRASRFKMINGLNLFLFFRLAFWSSNYFFIPLIRRINFFCSFHSRGRFFLLFLLVFRANFTLSSTETSADRFGSSVFAVQFSTEQESIIYCRLAVLAMMRCFVLNGFLVRSSFRRTRLFFSINFLAFLLWLLFFSLSRCFQLSSFGDHNFPHWFTIYVSF